MGNQPLNGEGPAGRVELSGGLGHGDCPGAAGIVLGRCQARISYQPLELQWFFTRSARLRVAVARRHRDEPFWLPPLSGTARPGFHFRDGAPLATRRPKASCFSWPTPPGQISPL